MKQMLACVFILITTSLQAQVTNRDNYDIRQPKNKSNDCKHILTVLREAPADVRFGTLISEDSVFLVYQDKAWFDRAFPSRNDGFAIDLMQQKQFQCDNVSRFAGSWSHRGFLLPPVYRDQMLKSIKIHSSGFITVFGGRIPASFKRDEIEANYLLLEGKNLCHYSGMVNLDFSGWQLLPMGLYYDTLSTDDLKERYRELSKTFRITIPFEKNRADFKPEDVKPLTDSLHLTDYAIKSITIRAYTSVEGSYERNLKLQQQRATSLVEALQSFQSEKIESTVEANENWVEFLSAINGTQFSSWLTLTKDEIKEKLKSPQVLNQLEPILRDHRKGIIEIKLEKRLSYKDSNPTELKKYFEQAVTQKNLDEALYLQEIIFYKIRNQELPDHFIHRLEVPEKLEYGSLLNNNAAFLYEINSYDVFEAMRVFDELDRLLPNNPKINYNKCALKIQSWLQTDMLVNEDVLKKEIEGLSRFKIHPLLIRRLMINYHIVLSEIRMREMQYAAKDKSVQYIFETYKSLKFSDDDLVNLAKYFSNYSKFDWAVKILEPRIKNLDVSEDLLYYYINLTIYSPKYTQGANYRAMMLNAVNQSRYRFCRLFDAIPNGGVSFQLLENSFLKKTYCENCQDLPARPD